MDIESSLCYRVNCSRHDRKMQQYGGPESPQSRTSHDTSAGHGGQTGLDKLVREAAQGNMEFVKKYLEKHPDQVDARSCGKSCLQVASHQGHINLVRMLLAAGANVNQIDQDGDSTLHFAAFGNQPEVMEVLLTAGARLDVLNAGQCSALHISAHKKPPHCVRVLLKHGADVNIQDSYGDTALHDAIGKESTEVIELLCNTPSMDITLRNIRGFNALHHSALKGNSIAAGLLLQRARQLVDVKKDDGFSALHLACLNGHVAVAELLVKRGHADINLRNNRKQTALLLAVSQGHCSVIEALVSMNCDLNAQDEDGDTALHLCIIKSSTITPVLTTGEAPKIHEIFQHKRLSLFTSNKIAYAIACYLVQEGCNLDTVNSKNKTVLDLIHNDEIKVLLHYFRARHNERLAELVDVSVPSPQREYTNLNLDALSLNEPEASSVPSSSKQQETEPAHISRKSSRTPLVGVKRDDASECIVCNEVTVHVVFEPCFHQIACEDCCGRIKKCLRCGAVVERRITAEGKIILSKSRQPSAERMRYLEKKIQDIEETHCCSICMERRRNVAFLCGHGACEKCAEPLKICHMCREKISKKINLY